LAKVKEYFSDDIIWQLIILLLGSERGCGSERRKKFISATSAFPFSFFREDSGY